MICDELLPWQTSNSSLVISLTIKLTNEYESDSLCGHWKWEKADFHCDEEFRKVIYMSVSTEKVLCIELIAIETGSKKIDSMISIVWSVNWYGAKWNAGSIQCTWHNFYDNSNSEQSSFLTLHQFKTFSHFQFRQIDLNGNFLSVVYIFEFHFIVPARNSTPSVWGCLKIAAQSPTHFLHFRLDHNTMKRQRSLYFIVFAVMRFYYLL